MKRRAIEQLETELNSSHTLAVMQAAAKAPAVQRSRAARADHRRGCKALSLDQGQGVLRENDAARSDDDRRRRQRQRRRKRAPRSSAPSAAGMPIGPRAASSICRRCRVNPPGEVKIPLPNIHQDYVTLEQLVPLPRSSPQYYPLVLGNAVLGGGSLSPEQSRLFRDIRQNAGLVYQHRLAVRRRRARARASRSSSPASEATRRASRR